MKQAFVIGIAGGTGSGKTTLAKRLKEDFENDVVLLCQDYYYKSFEQLTFEQRKTLNYDHPDAFDTSLLLEQLEQLKRFENIKRPVYSFIEHKRLEDCVMELAKRVVILEGILIFDNPELLKKMDIKVFVDTDADMRLARRLMRDIHDRGRDMDAVVNQYLHTVKPMHEAFVEPTKKKADVVIPEGGMNHVAFSMLVDKISSILSTWEV
jgi:uridine kinase